MKIESQLMNLRYLDELAFKATVIHRLSPVAKLLTTLIFIIVVTSFPKYEIASLTPLFLYPIIVIQLGKLPIKPLLKRLCLTLPFVLFIGIFNPLLDNTPSLQIGSFYISNGWLSFTSIIIRSVLAVTAALTLVATTGMNDICNALLQLKVPRILVVQLLFMYRYLYILLEEVSRTVLAHNLRSFHENGIGYKTLGSLLGLLLMRTLDRAQRIYVAMLCRGFDGNIPLLHSNTIRRKGIFYILCWSIFFVFTRLYNIPQWLGSLLTEVYK